MDADSTSELASKELEKVYQEAGKWGDSTQWTLEQYEKVHNILGAVEDQCGLPDNKGQKVPSEWYTSLQASAEQFEAAEGRRRAEAKKIAQQELISNRDQSLKFLKEQKDRVDKYLDVSWSNAKFDLSLNAPIISKDLPNSLFADPDLDIDGLVTEIQAARGHADNLVEKLSVSVLTTDSLTALTDSVNEFEDLTNGFEGLCQQEICRREAIEDAFKQEEEKKRLQIQKQKEEEEAAMKAEAAAKAEEDEALKTNEHAELVKKSEDLKQKRAAEKSQMLQDLEDEGDEDLKHRVQLEAQWQKEQNAKRLAELEAEMEKEMLKQEEAAEKQREQEEARQKELEAEKAKSEEDFKAQKLREEARERDRKLKAEAARAEIDAAIAKERALFDQGSDDEDDEKERRRRSRLRVRKYQKTKLQNGKNGSVWEAAKTDNIGLMKAYLMVQGTEKLISKHNYEDESQGGRTLLHTSCFYGGDRVIALLLKLGANANAIDNPMSKNTPLIEAARANNRYFAKFSEQGSTVV